MSLTLDGVGSVVVAVPGPPVVRRAAPVPPSVAVLPVAGGATGPLSAITLTAVAAVDLSGHRVVTTNVNGRLIYADPTNLAHVAAPLWVTTAAVVAGASATVVVAGVLSEPSWSWLLGPIWLAPGGVLTQVRPTYPTVAFLAAVGAAIDSDSVLVARQPSIVLN